MKKTLLLTFLAFAFTLFTEAQTTAQQRINDIKRQADRYVYADVTMPLQSDAVLMAKRQLGLVLEEWLRSEGYRKVRPDLATAIARQSETITTPRADMIRVFAYMEKERVERMVKKPSLLTALAPEHADALSGHQASTDSVAPSGLVAVEDTTLSEEVIPSRARPVYSLKYAVLRPAFAPPPHSRMPPPFSHSPSFSHTSSAGIP